MQSVDQDEDKICNFTSEELVLVTEAQSDQFWRKPLDEEINFIEKNGT